MGQKWTRRAIIFGISAGAANYLSRSEAQTGVVNLYSARHYDTDNILYENFRQRTGLRINLVEAKAEELIARIKAEGANSPADVIITVDAGNLYRAQQEGILRPVQSSVLERAIPSYLRDPQGHWFGLTKRARVIVYNKNKVSPAELSTYEDLANPKWRGRLISRTSNHVYNQSLMGSIIAAVGRDRAEEWARGIVANFARPPQGNDTAQIRDVAAGVADLTFVNHYYVARLIKSNKPEDRQVAEQVAVFFPNQRDRGTHVNISGAGVARNAPNLEGAIKFIEYLTSREAQDSLARANNEYPVVSGTAIDAVVRGFGAFKEDRLNAAEYARLNPEAVRIMDRAGWR
ncbi:MAG: Fe(3+) ABC transporter substrate-binding protein [Pseudanabaenaceae cyanobacterium]